MKITHDRRANAVYIRLTDGQFDHNQEINPDMILDLDANGIVIGIELLGVSGWITNPNEFNFQDITQQAPPPPEKKKQHPADVKG